MSVLKQFVGLFVRESKAATRALAVQTQIKAGRRGRGKDDAPNHG